MWRRPSWVISRGAVAGDRRPLDVGVGGGFQHGGDIGVAGADVWRSRDRTRQRRCRRGCRPRSGHDPRRPRMRATPNRDCKSSRIVGIVVASWVLPGNMRCAIGIPSPVTSSPIITCGRSRRLSRE